MACAYCQRLSLKSLYTFVESCLLEYFYISLFDPCPFIDHNKRCYENLKFLIMLYWEYQHGFYKIQQYLL